MCAFFFLSIESKPFSFSPSSINHLFLCSPDFKERLRDALVGKTIVYVDKPENAPEILKGYPDWECWYTVAPAKGASRMAVKVEEYRKEHGYPGIEHLGDCLRAMVVCRRGEESGNLLHRTWKQLEQAFDIHEGHGRLKNNYATAGILEGPKHQKPPDMLMNAVLDVDGAMSMPAEIQVHHEEILELKESKVHLLYEIARAKSIKDLRGGGGGDGAAAAAPSAAKGSGNGRRFEVLESEIARLKEEVERLKRGDSNSSGGGGGGGGGGSSRTLSGLAPLKFTCPISHTQFVWSEQNLDWEGATDK